MNVALSIDTDVEGGQLIAAVHGQIAYCQRELGEATVHDSAILHGRLSLEAVSLQ